ncbi:MAG: hypothetical protein KGV44_06120 [Flavobacteriaceae bacterium]|nr:hypothetical protein [Flavobacteriaceae bacterium]
MQIYIEILIVVLLFALIFERFYNRKNKAQKSEQEEEIKQVKEQQSSSVIGETKHIPKVKKMVEEMPKPTQEQQEETSKKSVVPTEELDDVFSDTEPVDLSEEEEELQALRSSDTDDDFATGLNYEDLQKIPEMIADDKITQDNIALAMKLSGTELLESLNEQMPQAQKRVSDLIDSYLNSPLPKNDNWESFDIREFV